MMNTLLRRILFFSILLFSFSSSAEVTSNPAYWNEVYDTDGTVRPQYKLVIEHIAKMTDEQVTAFIAKSKKLMSGDTPISPLPRMLTKSEYEELKIGTEQRALAIQAFLIDHYSGAQTYRDVIIPGEIIDSVLARTGELNYLDYYKNRFKNGDMSEVKQLFNKLVIQVASTDVPNTEKVTLPKIMQTAKSMGLWFRFLFGSDIIKDLFSEKLSLEDNLGFVGGTPGDTIPARQTWQGLLPELAAKLTILNQPADFLTELMDEMHKLAEPKIGFHDNEGVMVMLSSPPYGDNEDVRMAQEFQRRGVILVTPNTGKKKPKGTSKSLIVRADGVYLQERSKYGADLPERKVGMLWLNAEHGWVDWEDPIVREKALMEEARDYLDYNGDKLKRKRIGPNGKVITHTKGTKEETKELINAALEIDPKTGRINLQKLEAAIRWAQKNDYGWDPSVLTHKSPVPGLLRAILEGKVQSNYMPGAEFVGDKMIHSYIPALIKHYTGEDAILNNPPTERLFKQDESGKLVMDTEAIDRAMKNKNDSVAKVVDGRGGEGIHIGIKISPEEWSALAPTLQQEFLRYVNQAYRHPSVMEIKNDRGESRKYIADTRMFSWVGENGVIVSSTPWGRSTLFEHNGVSTKDDGKVNMSTGNGTLTLMLVVPDPKKCAAALSKAAE